MDQPYIDALVNQALGAYKAGGDEGLKRWKEALPAPHLVEFERDCGDLLLKAIAGLDLSRGPEADPPPKPPPIPKPPAPKPMELGNPRKKHTRDRRRTKPL